MKVPHSGRSEAGKHSGAAATNSVAASDVCPFTADCRRHWIVDSSPLQVLCGHCYQALSRPVLARILEQA